MIKIMIADDQELIRESLKIVLNMSPDMKVIATAENGIEAMESIKKNHPDIVLMDVRMPKLDGVQCTNLIKEHYPQIKIIILTTFDDDEYIYNALKFGASGYLLKGVSVTELTTAIRTVINGGAMINPNLITKVIKLFSEMAQSNFAVRVEKNGKKK
ncbi:response regulator transcription factor [Pectinatus frisingensis]|uniref:response regulator n=1 Tax=Pectinatus frisingensis TaxID=865 RepID=UPI001E58A53F|nr:response regulator transcription factor [Pectinatus frisingensis]